MIIFKEGRDRMFECRKCGRRNEEHYRFCLGCGGSLADQKDLEVTRASNPIVRTSDLRQCNHCNVEVAPSDVFCGACGKSLEQSPDTVPEGPFLVAIEPDGSEGYRHPIVRGENELGRTVAPFTDDPFVSPRHVTFRWDGSTLEVVDARGPNGVFVRIHQPAGLRHGARIRVGLELLEFEDLGHAEQMIFTTDDTAVHGSPDANSWGRLKRIAAPDVASHVWMLSGDEVSIGREQGDITFMGDGFVSGDHARIFRDGQSACIEDVGSSNGTFVEVEPPRALVDGDLLLIGQQLVKVALG